MQWQLATMLGRSHLNRRVIVVLLLAVCTIVGLRAFSFLSVEHPSVSRIPTWLRPSSSKDPEADRPPLWINDLDPLTVPGVVESDFCADRFSPRYLRVLRGRAIQYCPSSASSQFTCFHTHLAGQHPPNSFNNKQSTQHDKAQKAKRQESKQQEDEANETANGLIGAHSLKPT